METDLYKGETNMGIVDTKLWMDRVLPLPEFRQDFGSRFPGARIESVVENPPPSQKYPHHRVLTLLIPEEQQSELDPFMKEWAESHSAEHAHHARHPQGD